MGVTFTNSTEVTMTDQPSPAPASPAVSEQASFDAATKPYLQSTAVQGAFHGIAASALTIVFGASATAAGADADSLWSILVGAGTLISGALGLYGSIKSLIGRLRASTKLV